MRLKSVKTVRHRRAWVALALAVSLLLPFLISVGAEVDPEHSEYLQYVHTYVNSDGGNWTSVEKPMFPVYFNQSQIGIGSNWSVVCPLLANHSYHVYCYGKWVNNGSAPKTDYDIYVFNPTGVQESEHTEAAGLPEHLGTRVNDTFFAPSASGNYTFVIVNDARQSNDTQQATFMAIENIECDKWYKRSLEGKSFSNLPALTTSWACEFVTEKPRVEVWVKVPDTLDMYEARLYLMSNPTSLFINDAPLPWEPGLYGNVSAGDVGGYSLDSERYRGVAYASCEFRGQDMFLNYSSTSTGKTLYHLVLIGEAGEGDVDFLVKTSFGDACLIPSQSRSRIDPSNATEVKYVSNSTDLENAVLEYSTDRWNSSQTVEMEIVNRTCSADVPPQKAGTVVLYHVTANDTLMNVLTAEGNFAVKKLDTMNITTAREKARIGENVTIRGWLTGQSSNVSVTAQFMSLNDTVIVNGETLKNGTFTIVFQPNSTGVWMAQAVYGGSNTTYPCESNILMVTVEDQPFYVKNGVFIGGGFIGVIGVSGAVYYIRKRRQ
ncbi:MAG: hypothetical protein ACE14S_09770 [Candidatus Bathyarchaeia archaeon]